MSKYSRDFLADLLRLVSHGPEPIEGLISDLSDPERRRSLIAALIEIRSVASDFGKPRQQTVPPGRFSYADIQIPESGRSNPDRSEKLETILKTLTNSASFQSRPVLVDLAGRLNVSLVKKDSRARIVQKIVDGLATRDVERVTCALLRVREADRGSTESFMELASFITNEPTDTRAAEC